MAHPPARMTSPNGRLEAAFVAKAGMVGWSLRHDGDELLGHRASLSKYCEPLRFGPYAAGGARSRYRASYEIHMLTGPSAG